MTYEQECIPLQSAIDSDFHCRLGTLGCTEAHPANQTRVFFRSEPKPARYFDGSKGPRDLPSVRNREHPMWDEWTDHGRFYKIRTAANVLTVLIQILIVARLT